MHPLFAMLVLFASLMFSCKKTEKDPCEGLLSEGPLKKIGVIFVDKETGENLIISNNLDTGDVKFTPHMHRQIVRQNQSPLYGAVMLQFFEEKVGDYILNIQVGDFGTVKLSYTVSKVKTGDICRPHYYPLGDVKIVDYPFEPVKNEFTGGMSVLKVAL